MKHRTRSLLAAVVVLSIGCAGWIGAEPGGAAAKPVKRSLANFCKATKKWTAWETATLNTSGHLNEKWIVDTLSYIRPIVDTAPKDIVTPAYFTMYNLITSRRTIVKSVVGTLDVSTAVEELIGTGAAFSGADRDFTKDRDKFAAYSVAKCKVDWTVPFKAVGNS